MLILIGCFKWILEWCLPRGCFNQIFCTFKLFTMLLWVYQKDQICMYMCFWGNWKKRDRA